MIPWLTKIIGRLASTAVEVNSTTPISSNATPANIGIICSEKVQFRKETIRQGEDKTEMVGAKSTLKKLRGQFYFILPSS